MTQSYELQTAAPAVDFILPEQSRTQTIDLELMQLNPESKKYDLLTEIEHFQAIKGFCVGQVVTFHDSRFNEMTHPDRLNKYAMGVIQRIYRAPNGKIQLETQRPYYQILQPSDVQAIPAEMLDDSFIEEIITYEREIPGSTFDKNRFGDHQDNPIPTDREAAMLDYKQMEKDKLRAEIDAYKTLEDQRGAVVELLKYSSMLTNGDVPPNITHKLTAELGQLWRTQYSNLSLVEFLQLFGEKIYRPENISEIDPRLILKTVAKLSCRSNQDENMWHMGCAPLIRALNYKPDFQQRPLSGVEFLLPYFADREGNISPEFTGNDEQWEDIASANGWPISTLSFKNRMAILQRYNQQTLQIASREAV